MLSKRFLQLFLSRGFSVSWHFLTYCLIIAVSALKKKKKSDFTQIEKKYRHTVKKGKF